jgi:hypothetical protein
MTSDVDIFDGLASSDSDVTDETSETETDNSDTQETPVATVSEVPAGAMSVTEFASEVSQRLMREKIVAGEELDGTEYTIPQAVYQAIKAQRNPLPHVLVKDSDSEPRVYVLFDEAFAAWRERLAKNKERGTGAGVRASSRTPEDLLMLFDDAVKRALYAISRKELWDSNLEQANKLSAKYRGFLSEAGVEDSIVDVAMLEAETAYKAESEAKAAEKAAKKKSEKVPA